MFAYGPLDSLLPLMVSSHFGGNGFAASLLAAVMGLFTSMTGLAIPAGTALGGILAEILGTPLFFSLDGAFIFLLGIAIAFAPSVRRLD